VTKTIRSKILGAGGKSPHILDEGGKGISSSAWPTNLMEVIAIVASPECTCPVESKFTFELSMKAALKNWIQLLRHNCNLEDAIINDGCSVER
jgi:hypothetical protein